MSESHDPFQRIVREWRGEREDQSMNNGSGLKDIFAPICESGRMLVIVIADVHGPGIFPPIFARSRQSISAKSLHL